MGQGNYYIRGAVLFSLGHIFSLVRTFWYPLLLLLLILSFFLPMS